MKAVDNVRMNVHTYMCGKMYMRDRTIVFYKQSLECLFKQNCTITGLRILRKGTKQHAILPKTQNISLRTFLPCFSMFCMLDFLFRQADFVVFLFCHHFTNDLSMSIWFFYFYCACKICYLTIFSS